MKVKSMRELVVWQKAHQLVLGIYKIIKEFPNEEKFGLVSQMRRAVVSIPANIAEGLRKKGQKDKAHFYNIAQGSIEELRYYLILCNDLGYCETKDIENELDEISKLLHSYYKKLQTSEYRLQNSSPKEGKPQ